MIIHSKLPTIGTTIFSQMSQLAAEYNAVNLGQGFPGFETDGALHDLVYKFMRKGYNQYAPMGGVSELTAVISQKIKEQYHTTYDAASEITITAGATQAIFTAITAFIQEGDEVILFAPAYDCYAPAIEVNGGNPVWVNLHYPDYKVNWNEVKKLINHRTRMIIINTPHNPSGACFSAQDMQQLEKIIAGTDIILLSDEVYEHMVFDDKRHESICLYPGLRENTLAVYSFGKTLHTTGWKMGYVIAPESLMREFRKVHQYNVFSCNTPVQYALAEYLQQKEHYTTLSSMYAQKRNYFLDAISGSRFSSVPSEGTYFQLLCYKNISDRKDTEMAIEITKKHGVASIPCSVFYPDGTDEKVLRFCFAKEETTLQKAAELLCKI